VLPTKIAPLPDDLVLRPASTLAISKRGFGIAVVSANGDLLEADQYGLGTPHGLPPERPTPMCKEVLGSSVTPTRGCRTRARLEAGLGGSCSSAASGRSLPLRRRSANRFTPARDGRMETSLGANAVYLWLSSTIRQRLGHKGLDRLPPLSSAYLLKNRG